MSKEILLELKSINRVFADKTRHIKVLDDVSLQVHKGEKVAIVGPSGSGKSSLLYIMGLLDKPTAGQVLYHKKDMVHTDDKARSQQRNSALGFVYQYHHLLPEFTALENVLMPAIISGHADKHHETRAKQLLQKVGVIQRAGHYPSQLSGGEQQRVAVARALLNKPEVLFADEPTGNLDTQSADKVFALFEELAESEGVTLVLVTHNHELASRCDNVYKMDKGRLVKDGS